MRKKLLFLCMAITVFVHAEAQQSLRNARKQSWQTLVYRIPADTAEKYIGNHVVFPDHYLEKSPAATWWSDSLRYGDLPVGTYLLISVKENELVAEYYCQSKLSVLPLNNQHRVQLEIKEANGNYPENAKVWVNKKEIKYDASTRSYTIRNKKPDDAVIKIAIPGDTLFMELSAMEKVYKNEWQQWWTNISYTKGGRIITWPVRAVKKMINQPSRYWFQKRPRKKYYNNGYAVFNKPKYLPKDTVKFKAYVLNKKRKPYKKELAVFLEYSASGQYISKNIATIKPTTSGSFIHEFIIGDSLDSDKTYSVLFKTHKGTVMMRSSFRIEDYLLDEMASYTFRSEKENYYRQDTMRFYASAKDANGLAVMDGRINFYLLTKDINKTYKENEFVPDTLWKQDKILAIDGDTQFEIPGQHFPAANLTVRALAVFLNSNNETEEKETEIEFQDENRIIKAQQDGAFISALYIENGKSSEAKGWLILSEDKKPIEIHFPYREKIDPFVSSYEFKINDSAGKVLARNTYEPGWYTLSFIRLQQKDTTGFFLYNPNKILVHYTVFNGQKIIAGGVDSSDVITWKKVLPKKKIYNVEWNYVWAGEEQKGRNTIALLDKILNTSISNAQTIYPGQKDTIKVLIKDYKGNPAANVNLAAVSYNSQFKEAIKVAEPPYLQRFKTKRRILFDEYEMDDAGFTRRLLLGEHQQWRNKFGLDTMAYYQLLFPKKSMAIISRLVNEFVPQLAVHVVKKGVPQEIYMLYINREFAWYNGVTDKSNYAFPVAPGYTQIGFRLKDKFIELDSIYLQPFYKHDISIDIDQLPAKVINESRPEHYTAAERNRIERGIWQLQNDNLTNYGYVWQGNKLVFLDSRSIHHVGPFSAGDSLQFFKPGVFDFKFLFEPGYEYKLTPKMARLEMKNIFPAIKEIMLPVVKRTTWVLGDTVRDIPDIKYPIPVSRPVFKANDFTYLPAYKNDLGSLKIELPKDSVFIYGILYNSGADSTITRIRNYGFGNFYNVSPGKYNLVLITSGFSYLVAKDLNILANGTLCLRFIKPVYETDNSYINQLMKLNQEISKKEMEDYFEQERLDRKQEIIPQSLPLPTGNGVITGKVTDRKGKSPIPGVAVMVKGYNTGVSTSPDGSFRLQHIRPGSYVLVISSIGYQAKEMQIAVTDRGVTDVNVELTMAEYHLDEVVVTGYGTARRKSLTGSIATVRSEEIITSLQGKVAGINISGIADNNNSIQVRGISSFADNAKPLYVVNGVMMDELPAGFDMSQVQVNVLDGETATGLYGSRAADGVILITTNDFLPATIRDKFRDYAFWQPNLITDKNGEVRFAVTYPDNITGWQTYIVGMDKKRRFTKATSFTKSFKPLLARLSAPQFLIEGDSCEFIGKVINYTKNNFSLATDFRLDNKTIHAGDKELKGNSSVVDALPVFVNNNDTLAAQYTITASSGYSDGELIKIPVFKKGVEEAKGNFWILDKDTSFSFMPDENAGDVILYAQNNTLDVLLDELIHLKEYPYYCMEQCASKLTGILMEKKIRHELKQPFKNEKEIQRLLQKLQKGQLFDGGWSWWEGGAANLTITNYVIQSLLHLRNESFVATAIRNGLLYLQNRLPSLKKDELIATLFTMSEANHLMDYQSYLSKLVFDSLTIHQQWQVVKIKQNQKLDFEKELTILLDKKTETMLGGLYWGDTINQWDRNDMATTALAFKVFERETNYHPLLKQMIQFFLERRTEGRWGNTVESAATVAAILPTVLQQNNKFISEPELKIKTNKIIAVEKFPFTYKINNSQQPLTITRSGGGFVYFTAWQKVFNPRPEPVTHKFIINTWFERSGTRLTSLVAGEKTVMKVDINVLKDADYVQIEIPVPAGCTFAAKKQDDWKTHKEYLKDKMVVFVEKMEKGIYRYEIELEPRYTGVYHLNPAKAELMYFPVYYGRNNIKKLAIVK